jgi:hypothetical protein
MAEKQATIVITFAWEDGATLGPDYGNEPVTGEEIAQYLAGADWALVPGTNVLRAQVAPEGNLAV